MLAVFSYWPAMQGLAYAFQEVSPGGDSRWVGLANFRRIAGDGILLRACGNMAVLAAADLVKGTLFPLLAAVLVSRVAGARARQAYQSAFVFPIVVPGMVAVLLWKDIIYDGDMGLLNQALSALGLGAWRASWLGEHRTALAAVAFGGFPWVTGLGFLVFLAGLLSIPVSVMESATVDGVGPVRRFWSIERPLVWTQARLVVVLTLVGTVQNFGSILLMTGGGPGASTHVPALHMYYMGFRFDEFGYAAALGFSLFVLIIAVTALSFAVFRTERDAA